MKGKFPPGSSQARDLDLQRQAFKFEMTRIRLIMDQRKVEIAQRTGTAVNPNLAGQNAVGSGSQGGPQSSARSGMQAPGSNRLPTSEFGQLNLGGSSSGGQDQSKLMQWRTPSTPERSTPNDNWMQMAGNPSGFSPNSVDGRGQSAAGAPAVVEFVPGKPWAGLSLQSTDDDPHMTPASAAKPPLTLGSDSYLDSLSKTNGILFG